MSRVAYGEPPRNERLYNLLRRVRRGDILVPRFQRPFVWSDEQRLLLFDSIYRRLPIGSFIVWRTRTNLLACFDRIAGVPVSIPAPPAPDQSAAARDNGDVLSYLLDGHQRLTSLYASLADGLVAEEEASEADPQLETPLDELPGDDRPRRIFFDLADQTFKFAAARGGTSATWVPLSIVFNRYALRHFELTALYGHPEDRRLINRLGELVDRLKDYDVPVITLASEEQDEATEAFSRVNSAGTPIGQVDMVGAAVWNDGIDLKRLVDEEVLRPLADVGWQHLDKRMVLNTVKAQLGLDIYRSEIGAIREKLKQSPSAFAEAARNLKRAADLLRRCGIRGPAVLPYSYQIVLLADALGRVRDHRDQAVIDRLTRWLWATTYGELFAGMNSTRLRLALDHVRAVARGEADPIPDDLDRVVVPITRFDFRSARSRALAVAMAVDWEPVRRDGKKAWPLKLLAEEGNDALPKLVVSVPKGSHVDPRCLAGPENRFISRPAEANLLRRDLLEPARFREVIGRSHGLTPFVVTASRKGGVDALLHARRLVLLETERKRVEAIGLRYAHDPLIEGQ